MTQGFYWAGIPGSRIDVLDEAHDLALAVDRDERLRRPICTFPVNQSRDIEPDRLTWAF